MNTTVPTISDKKNGPTINGYDWFGNITKTTEALYPGPTGFTPCTGYLAIRFSKDAAADRPNASQVPQLVKHFAKDWAEKGYFTTNDGWLLLNPQHYDNATIRIVNTLNGDRAFANLNFAEVVAIPLAA